MRYSPLGTTGFTVSNVCVGTSPLGGMAHIYGHDVQADDAVATIAAAFASPINFLDTGNNYGAGKSEERIGRVIGDGLMPEGFVLASKADPLPGGPFGAERVRESFRETIERLGVPTLDVFYLHDPERFPFEEMSGPGGAVEGMLGLKADGLVASIGVAGGDLGEMRRYVDTGAFKILLNHNQFTVIDQSASELIDHALAAGLAFVNAAPYASGILAKGADQHARYRYGEPSDAITDLIARLRSICAEHEVDLAAVALQFSTRDPRITSTVVGVSKPDRVTQLVLNAGAVIPDVVWTEVAGAVAEAR